MTVCVCAVNKMSLIQEEEEKEKEEIEEEEVEEDITPADSG